jgi:bifunctional ADP-heptose synthase (sugar kinase/adenylyltransferase)
MRILVIGDYIQDVYTFGTAVRLCPEAPVPVLIPQITRESLGGAGLVWDQLKELGADTLARFGSKSTKHRYFAGNHLIARVDNDSIGVGWDAPLKPSLDWADAFVIADYGKGAITPALAHQIVETGLPCFVDAKHHWHWYSGRNVTIFPNEHECLDETFMADQVVRKLGKNGCEHFNVHLPASVSEVVDVTGAGDIFMAGFVFAWSLDFKPESCLRFANAIAGESCRHVGTYVVPRAFAQAYLDRLRASEAPAQQALDRLSGSNELLHPPTPPLSPEVALASNARSVGNLLGDCMSAAIAALNLPGRAPLEQTPLRSPSVPTELNVSRIQEGPESSDELGTKSQLGAQGQNPSASERQRANILARDPD